jgi:hypothetical protein
MPVWPAQPPESTAFPFNRQERARLAIYRAAVAAGFYTDTVPGEPRRGRGGGSLLSGDLASSALRS